MKMKKYKNYIYEPMTDDEFRMCVLLKRVLVETTEKPNDLYYDIREILKELEDKFEKYKKDEIFKCFHDLYRIARSDTGLISNVQAVITKAEIILKDYQTDSTSTEN